MNNCLIVVEGSCNDYYGVYCHKCEDTDTMKYILDTFYFSKDYIEDLLKYGSIKNFIYEFPNIKIIHKDSNKEFVYFSNFNELIDSYRYVKNIFIFTKSNEWKVNPKSIKEETCFLDDFIKFIFE